MIQFSITSCQSHNVDERLLKRQVTFYFIYFTFRNCGQKVFFLCLILILTFGYVKMPDMTAFYGAPIDFTAFL